jgi:pyochelin synthetase
MRPHVPEAQTGAAELVEELEGQGAHLWEQAGMLRFRAPAGVMTDEWRSILRTSKPLVLDFLRHRARPPVLDHDPGRRYERFPLTDVQTAYLLGRRDAFDWGGVACHGYGELPMPDVDPGRLESAWQTLIERHDMLRAIVEPDGFQRVLAEVPDYRVLIVDLRGERPEQADAAIDEIREQMSHRIYQPDQWPLFELRVSRTARGPRLHLSIDFLICDLVSTQLLFDELYQLCYHPESPLPPLEITYRDYLVAEQRPTDDVPYERDSEYWLRRIDDLPPAPELPLLEGDRRRPVRFRRRQLTLTAGEWAGIRLRAGAHNVTGSVAVLAAYAEVIGRWSRSPRFTLDATLQNRQLTHPQVGLLVGDFTSVELLAVDSDPGVSFRERSQALQARLWEDLDHRLFSGLRVAREVSRRDGPRAALFPVVFTSAIGVGAEKSDGYRLSDLAYGITQTPQAWIDCQALESEDSLIVNWDVRDGVFPDGLVDDMFSAFGRLLNRMATEDEVWESTDVVPLPAAQLRTRRRVNDTAGPISDALLHEGVVDQARREPDRVAVVSSARVLSYRELVDRAQALAEDLSARGCGRGEIVAVAMDKSWRQIVGVLGILLAHGAYLPIESDQPVARRDQIMADAGVRMALVGPEPVATTWPSGIQAIVVDDRPPPPPSSAALQEGRANPDDLAYVIYTSGSTGAPKGVMVSHRSAVNTVDDINRRFEVTRDDRVLGLASLGFDLSVYDVFGLLAVGGGLVLPEAGRTADPSHWAQLVARHGVTLWNSVPAQLQMLYDYLASDPAQADPLASLSLALLSGDWIPVALPDRIRRLLPGLRLISLGGATEAAIWSICQPIGAVGAGWSSIPYGVPLTNQSFHVLDTALRPCPDWVAGELYIGGIGVALGYLGDTTLTEGRFGTHGGTGERLYRTGDLGFYRPDGVIVLLGRQDRQVKIRGHRIELAEIEAAIGTHPAVGTAVIIMDGDTPTERRIVAFVESAHVSGVEHLPPEVERRLTATAVTACSAVTGTVDAARYAQYHDRLDDAALLSMLYALRAQGVFAGPDPTLDDVLAFGEPAYHRLMRRWLRALEERGLVRRDPATMRYRDVHQDEGVSLEEMWSQVEDLARGVEAPGVVAYFSNAARRLPALLAGAEDPLALLFPEGRVDVSTALYRDAVVSRATNRMLGAAAGHLATEHAGHRPLRILEVGAGVGATSDEVLASLSGVEADYLFTDLSPFFIVGARERLVGNPTVRFAVFDLDQDYRRQGLEPNSFDMVLAADVLHGVGDLGRALARLRELLVPGGWLLFSELTRDHYPAMASLELLVSRDASVAAEEPRGADETFLSASAWPAALERAGLELVTALPQSDAIVSGSGMQVFAARAKRDRRIPAPSALAAHVADRLPEYMAPGYVQVVDALPLTANGKIDHRALRSWLPRRDEDPGAAPAAFAGDGLSGRLARLWAEVLGVPVVAERGFLELGGDSLLAARLAGRLREEFPEAAEVFFDDLLRHILHGPTVTELATYLTDAAARPGSGPGESGQGSPLVRLGGSGPGPVWVLVHDGGGDLGCYDSVLADLTAGATVAGLVVTDEEAYLNLDPRTLVDQVADAYAEALMDEAILSVRLVGAGAGGALAVEVARRLTEAGAAVQGLTVLGEFPAPGISSDPDAEESVRAHTRRALDGYEVSAYAGDLLLVSPQGDAALTSGDFWRQACLGDVRVIEVPGGGPDRRWLRSALAAWVAS